MMLLEGIDDPAATDPADLHRRYLERLATVIETAGIGVVAEETGIASDRLDSLPDTDPGLTLAEAADILAVGAERETGKSLREEARDHLLLRMSSAVVDVDALATALSGEFEARDYQQMIEGEMPMALSEYARISLYIERQNPF